MFQLDHVGDIAPPIFMASGATLEHEMRRTALERSGDGREILIPSVALKKLVHPSSGKKPFLLILPDLLDLSKYSRPISIAVAPPQTFL